MRNGLGWEGEDSCLGNVESERPVEKGKDQP